MTPPVFPVLNDWREKKLRDFQNSVPWALLAPHEHSALRIHGQTLAELARRGGLGVQEMVGVIEHLSREEVVRMTRETGIERLREHLARFERDKTASLTSEDLY